MSGLSAFNHTGDFLASVVDSLDSQILRIQSSNISSNQTGSDSDSDSGFVSVYPLKELKLGTCIELTWIGGRSSRGFEDQYLGVLFDSGSFEIYSPVLNEMIEFDSQRSKYRFDCLTYCSTNDQLYSYSNDMQELIEWDIHSWSITRKISVAFENNNGEEKIERMSHIVNEEGKVDIILASHCIYIIDLSNGMIKHSVPSHVNKILQIKTIIFNKERYILTNAMNDRFINMLKYQQDESSTAYVIDKIFVSDSEVSKFDISFSSEHEKSILSVITEDGIIEVFNDSLNNNTISSSISRKSRRKVNSVKSDYRITINRIMNNNSKELILLNDINSNSKELCVSYFEDNNIILIEKITWTQQGSYVIDQDIEINKKKEDSMRLQRQFSKYGHDRSSKKLYNESHAVVMHGNDFKDLDNNERQEGEEAMDVESAQAPQKEEEEEEEEEDSFKEIVSKTEEMNKSSNKKKDKSKITLVVILNQAIRSNDDSLLEMVLNNKDEEIIQNTIKKLDSNIIIQLLNRLSEKIMRNKNRLLNLNYWIKNILIYHSSWIINNGGTNKLRDLSILIRLLNDKSKNLNKLYELKGKIDIMSERIEIKKELGMVDQDGNQFGDIDADQEMESADIEYIEDFEDLEESDSEDGEDEDEEMEDEDEEMEDEDEEMEDEDEEMDDDLE